MTSICEQEDRGVIRNLRAEDLESIIGTHA